MDLAGAVLVAASPGGPVRPVGRPTRAFLSGQVARDRSAGRSDASVRLSVVGDAMVVLPGIQWPGVNADGASASGRMAPMIGFRRPDRTRSARSASWSRLDDEKIDSAPWATTTLVDGEPSARTGGASRPSNEGNNNFLVW